LNNCSAELIAAARALELPVPPTGLHSLGGTQCGFFPWRTPRAGPW
jgi:hypothetical protein